MTRNNLDEHLSWLLSNAGVSRPIISTSHATFSGTDTQTPINGAQGNGQRSAVAQGNDMARELQLQKQRVPSLVSKQKQQLLTPASVTPSGRFEQGYSQFLKNRSPSVRPIKQHESPLLRTGCDSKPAPLLTPDFPDDDDDEVVEITAFEAAGSSNPAQFSEDVKLWNEKSASRPEPRPAKAKKRKSDEITRAWASDDDDEFPDLDDLVSTPAAPKSSVTHNFETVTARAGLRITTVEPRVKSTSPTRRNRTPSPVKSPRSSRPAASRLMTQQSVRTPVASPRKLPPVTLQPNALSPDTIHRALTRTPQPAKTRRNSVIEETDEEFVTPSSGGRSPKVPAAVSAPITAIPCTFEASISKFEPRHTPNTSVKMKPSTKDQAQSSCAATPSRKRVSPRKIQTTLNPSADLQGLENLVEKPWPLQRRLDALQEELEQNRRAFEGALREAWPREKREEIRAEKEHLSNQQTILKGLLERTEAYGRLNKDCEALLEHISEGYRANRCTADDEDRLDQLQDILKSEKQSFSESLSEVASQHPQLIEQLKAIPPPSTSRIPQTQPSASRHHQNHRNPPVSDCFSSQVVYQTQLPDEPPPPSPFMPRGEPPPINPDEFEGMFSDDSPVQCRPPARKTLAQTTLSGFTRSEEHDYLSDDFDPDMLALADSFTTPGPSTSNGIRRRSPLQETSGNAKPPARYKGPEKRIASTAAKTPFSPEQMQFPWSPEVKQMLKDRFRMEYFRHNQLEAINATLSGKDAFILMPTGGGKSLCYQLPAVVKSGTTKGITIVVSPLLSLMQDQVDHLNALNIHAVAFNGESTKEYKDMVMKMFKEANPDNFIELLYVTPEMMSINKRFQDALEGLHRKRKLARIVIDEAHCVSQWGHDFRPDYKQLGQVRKRFSGVPLMALTATATENVIMDVMHNLDMKDAQIFTQSFNRANLYYEVRLKSGPGTVVNDIINLINEKYEDQCGIVYTISRKSTESVAKKLREAGIKAAHYHASVDAADKAKTQRLWQSDRVRVVVATIAFGMGIDKPDVRFVIHHGIPKSLEGYYQETGRAGRDGKPSDCYLYFSLADVRVLRKMILSSDGSWEQQQRQLGMLNRMVTYCDNPADCRRVEVLSYFGEAFDKADCKKTCDNCRKGVVSEQRDYSQIAKAVIEAVAQEDQLTPNQCAEIIIGKRTPEKQYGDIEYYGVAGDLKKYEVERIIGKLVMENALREKNKIHHSAGFAVQYLKLGDNVNEFRYGHQKLMLPVQVSRGSKEPAVPQPRKRAKKDDASRPPASTDFSSPVAPMSRKKTHTRGASSTDMGSLELTRNGYEQDDFVVDSDDDEYFAPVSKKRKSNAGKTAESSGPSGLQDTRLESLPEIHQEVVQNFVNEAKKMEESIRNNAGMRRPLFSEQNFQDMAIHWTTTPQTMRLIRGIDEARVDMYGERFARLVKKFHEEYTDMMGLADDDADMEVVDLISSDVDVDDDDNDEDGFEYDLEPDDEPAEKSRFFSAPPPPRGRAAAGAGSAEVEQWHQRLNQVSQKPPGESGARQSSAAEDAAEFWTGGDGGGGGSGGSGGRGSRRGGRGGGRGGRGFRKGRKFSGVSKRKSGGNTKGGGGTKGGSSFGKGGRGGGKGGGSSGIGLMPH